MTAPQCGGTARDSGAQTTAASSTYNPLTISIFITMKEDGFKDQTEDQYQNLSQDLSLAIIIITSKEKEEDEGY